MIGGRWTVTKGAQAQQEDEAARRLHGEVRLQRGHCIVPRCLNGSSSNNEGAGLRNPPRRPACDDRLRDTLPGRRWSCTGQGCGATNEPRAKAAKARRAA